MTHRSAGGASIVSVPEFELNVKVLQVVCDHLYGGNNAAMAEACGVGYKTLRSWFEGRSQPTATTLAKVSYATQVPMTRFMKRVR